MLTNGLYDGVTIGANVGTYAGLDLGITNGMMINSDTSDGLVQRSLSLNYDASSRASFDGNSTTKLILDLTPNANAGMLSGSATYTSLLKGGISLPGSSWIKTTSGSANAPDSQNNWTIQAAFLYNVTSGTITLTAGYGNTFPQIRFVNNAVQVLRSLVTNIGTFANSTLVRFTPYVLAMTKRFTGSTYTYDLYINGVYRSSLSNVNNFNAGYPVIGANGNGFESFTETFNGVIFSYQWYNTQLTDGEIARNYYYLRSRFGFKKA